MSQPAVLLLNLGSPDSPAEADVRRYLQEFLSDDRVFDVNPVLRSLVLKFSILPTRPKTSGEAYAKIWTAAGSPLIVTSRRVQEKVQGEIGPAARIALAMRYGEPSTARVVAELKQSAPSRVLLVPLYPHYAMSSYESAVATAERELAAQLPRVPVDTLAPFYADPAFVAAQADVTRPFLTQGFDKILFSYHGIPYRHLQKSDPSHAHCLSRPDCCDGCHPSHATCYRHQCLRGTELLATRLGLVSSQYEIAFQSRLGRTPWLTPYTDFRLRDLPKEGVKRLLVLSPAFVSDCLETLEELAMRGREIFEQAGGKEYALIPCLNEHPSWIDFLRDKIQAWLATAPSPSRPRWSIPTER